MRIDSQPRRVRIRRAVERLAEDLGEARVIRRIGILANRTAMWRFGRKLIT